MKTLCASRIKELGPRLPQGWLVCLLMEERGFLIRSLFFFVGPRAEGVFCPFFSRNLDPVTPKKAVGSIISFALPLLFLAGRKTNPLPSPPSSSSSLLTRGRGRGRRGEGTANLHVFRETTSREKCLESTTKKRRRAKGGGAETGGGGGRVCLARDRQGDEKSTTGALLPRKRNHQTTMIITAKRGACFEALRSDSNHGQLIVLCLKAVGKFSSQLSKAHFEPRWLARYVRRRRRRPVPRFWSSPAKSHSSTLALLLGKKGLDLEQSGLISGWLDSPHLKGGIISPGTFGAPLTNSFLRQL